MWTIFLLIGVVSFLGLAFWLLFIWAVKSGQYEDSEDIKYRILDEDGDNP